MAIEKKYFPIKSATACQLKWTWTTILLYTGETLSCHRAGNTVIQPEDFDTLHNTPRKLTDRKMMLEGKWPGHGCEYCRDIESAGGSSDRLLHLNIPDLTPVELESAPQAIAVTPRILEIYLNNTCNLACLYCSGKFSSKLNFENSKYLSDLDLNTFGTFRIVPENQQLKYLEKLWSWLEQNARMLKRIHVEGGEPFYQREFDQLLDFFEHHPCPQLEFNIVTNLSISKSKLVAYLERIKQLIAAKKIRRLDISCSIDCWGPEQEYVRYGLDLVQWEDNFNYLLTLPWLVLNINQTISVLGIKTMPVLLEKLQEWKKIKTVNQFFSGVTPDPSYLKPNILGGDIFAKDFERILELMPVTNEQEQQAKKYMEGLWLQIASSDINVKEVENLKIFLDEIDRRRNTNWRELFKWIP